MEKMPYNDQLKTIALEDIPFHEITLDAIPAPYYEDYSHHQSAMARAYKSYDTMGFRDELLGQLSKILNQRVVRLLVITPKEKGAPYDAFAYLSDRHIAALHFNNAGYFKQWMDIIFKDEYEEDLEGQFMLILGKGTFSQKWINTGMLIDERPYENTGAYLYKNAPKQYNEAKIAREKQHYIKKYVDTSGAGLDSTQLKERLVGFLKANNLRPTPPKNHEGIYGGFETLSGYGFPPTLKTLFTRHDGIGNTGFLTAGEVLDEWKNWKAIYDDVNWELMDLTGNNKPDGKKTLGIYTNPYWVPFFSTGGGNFLAIDYAPGSQGKSGQIIAFGADEVKIRFIAEDMDDFIRQLTAGMDVLNNGFEEETK